MYRIFGSEKSLEGISVRKKVIRFISVLLILIMSFSIFTGCGKSNTKEITNIEDKGNKENNDISGSKGESPVEILENKEEDKKEEKDKNTEETKEEQDKSQDKKTEETKKEENVVVIDGVTYKNYKGPVQGEKKYKEGTPAKENSDEYKATGDIESPYKVNLIVTTGFGHKKVFAKNVGMVKDEVGMEVLFRNLDIQTAYGGGFVNAINGIESKYTFFTGDERKEEDWFYWVNGILAPIGVAEYRPKPGDVIWWDYHDWSITMFIPAVIGSYPQPFKSGFQGKNPGTVILYTSPYANEAEKLKKSLQKQGVTQIDIGKYDAALIENPKKYYIVLGVWNDLVAQSNITNSKGKEINLMKDINEKNKFVGVNSKFEGGKVHALNFKGETVSSYEQGGAIYAYAAGIGSTKPIWMITGTDDEGFKMAYNVLLNEPQKIKDCFGAVVSKNGVEKVPYLK